jgi:2-methylisocitrate lyase-like PEP mutase family enzyme
MKEKVNLRKMMKKGETVVAIGAYDPFSAILVERAGFNGVYVGSFITEASFLGGPDLGLMTKTERLMLVRNIVKSVNIPVIADMEEGYGNAIHVMDAVKDFENAGVSGIHIDDEAIPCKCPFLPGIPKNTLISVDEMCGKIKAAVLARKDPNFLIIARSDVIGTVTLEEYRKKNMIDEVVKRSNAYAKAGADAIFIMALTLEDMRYFARKIKAPLVGVFATIEPFPIREFEKAGCKIVIGSTVGLYMAARGMIDGLKKLKETGDWNAVQDKMINDRELFEIVGLKNYKHFYNKFKIT